MARPIRGLRAAHALPELLGGQLAARAGQRIGHQQPLRRDALAGGAQSVTGGRHTVRLHHTVTPTAPAQTEKR